MLDDEETVNGSKNIKVFVRILPLLKRCDNCMKISPDKKTIFMRCLQNMKQEKNPLYWSFKTNGVFYDCSQKEIYRETTQNIINKALDGAKCVVISCGQTGTGKSFTLGGLRNNWEHRGLVPRLLADLLVAKARKKHTNKIRYSLSHVEFRGKKFKDLLNPNFPSPGNGNKSDPFKVFEDSTVQSIIDCDNITRVSIKGQRHALRYIFQGEGRRALAEGSVDSACHLGTAVVTFHVHNTSLITSWAVITEAAIHIVEMAGIDTPGKASCSKKARDVVAANLMKLEMEHFIANLSRSKITASPFGRSSSLIKYLGDALSRTSVIRFIAHVRVTKEDLDVALSTLRLAAKIAQLQPLKIRYKVKPQDTMIVDNLYKEIAQLKRELDVNEMFFGQEAVTNVSKRRAEQIEQDFLGYLNGTISDVKLLSLSQAQVLVKMMKDLYAKITAETQEAQRNVEKCEMALKNTARNTSKTSVQGSGKDTSQKNSNVKDRVSVTSAEVIKEAEIKKVGALEDTGITLGPGLREIPASSALRALNVAKTSRAQSREQREEMKTEGLENEESQANMRQAFKVMQKMLARLIEAGPEPRKRWDTSTAFSRTD